MWIDAKEALPESLCIAQYYTWHCVAEGKEFRKQTVMAQYVKSRTVEYLGDYEEWADYDEEKDIYWCQPGWYARGHEEDEYGLMFIEEEVFRWMEIPD